MRTRSFLSQCLRSLRKPFNTITQWYSYPLTTQILRVLWVALVLWYEVGTFQWAVSSCKWPDATLLDQTSPSGSTSITHILLLADPQILDMRSYPSRGYFLSMLSQFIVDFFLRKSWYATLRQLGGSGSGNDAETKLDAVVFLGDMMDNGRLDYDDAKYQRYYDRFKSIFTLDSSIPVFYIPGNHDIGLGGKRTFSPHSHQRYISHFGSLNQRLSLGNHTLVFIDAPGLVDEDYQRVRTGHTFETWDAPKHSTTQFIKDFAAVGSGGEPVILFSHIPLFRPDTASCGPLRERGSIHRGAGFGYQNTLMKDTTGFLLRSTRPVAVYSGDDHDYCEYTHSTPFVEEGPEPYILYSREVSVKSSSMAMGIKRPGFQLLSLADPATMISQKNTYADALCLLPDQIGIYTSRYIPLILLTIVFLFIINVHRRIRGTSRHGNRASSVYLNARPESAVWSPPTPPSPQYAHLHSPKMPLSELANASVSEGRHFRTPSRPTNYLQTPNFRVSRPSTPLDSPALGPLNMIDGMGINDVDTDDDMNYMGSVQYARRPQPHEVNSSYFLPSPGLLPRRRSHKRWSWSWTFVFRGRRRRITIRAPGWLSNPQGTRESSMTIRSRSLLASFWGDIWAVACPAVLTYIFIAIWMFY